jgi:peptidoglycan/xylan/chitin deacetylase (PgdA/CDA1 family)
MNLDEIKEYARKNNIILKVENEYNDLALGKVVKQSIAVNTAFNKNDILIITMSLGPIPTSLYKDNNVNELGNIPIMMYHSIVNKTNDETPYTGGNVDKNGYNRTTEAFRNDLEMYYQKGYQMIRLNDYINGNINIPLGKSPLILTFDDGNSDNFLVTGIDDYGNLIIDPNSAIGILESFKKKYKDFNVTATFFLNAELFGQSKYNNKILEWLVNNGYDIGNHTRTHTDITKIDATKTQSEVAYMYQLFDTVIPNEYVHIIALPYGSPYEMTHPNFPYILEGNYDGYTYKTDATLQVGWDADYSPFHKNFNKTFLKRVRAWDNNGTGFDIEQVFNNLDKNRYISDGNKDTIVISNDTNLNLNIKDKKIIKY